jgi:hypothetical protein
MAELRVAVRVLAALPRFRVRLQAVTRRAQQRRGGPVRDWVPRSSERVGDLTGRLARPAQRSFRISAGSRVHQRVQRLQNLWIGLRHRLASPAGPARPTLRQLRRAIQLGHASVTVDRATPATRATADTPPQPSSRASAPSNSRRCRSLNDGHNVAMRRPTASAAAASIATPKD